jgi:outer membrane protein OmpA-like peptidoglycan-associated protein
MKVKLLLTSCLSLVLVFGASAQADDKNLVQNPSFETTTGKLRKLKQIEAAKTWLAPTGVPADLYSEKADSPISVPANPYGNEKPMEGSNYAGFVAYSYRDKEPRTYLQTELLGPLKAGVKYCVQFNVSLADKCKYASNNIQAHLAKKQLKTDEKESIIVDNAQVMHSKNKVYNYMYNWHPVCSVVEAKGGEKFLTIGNFTETKNTLYEKMKLPKGFSGTQRFNAYYYVDNVQVFQLDSLAECDCEAKIQSGAKTIVIYEPVVNIPEEATDEEKIGYYGVYFDFIKSTIETQFNDDLDAVAVLMKSNPGFNLELHAHADKNEIAHAEKSIMNAQFKDIAQKRADAVVGYLKRKGVASSRIVIKIHDDAEPAMEADNDVARAKNRRVVFNVAK